MAFQKYLIQQVIHELVGNFILDRAISREFLGTLFFEMVIFSYRQHGCLGVRKLKVFNTSDPLETYSVESNT